MDRWSKVKDYVSSVNRSVLLAIGLVVIAGLIAAVFVYGDNDTDTATTDTNGTTVEETTNGEATGDADAEFGSDDENENENGEETTGANENGEDQPAIPSELADTGPAAPLVAVGMLAGSAYLHRRSKQQIEAAQLNQ